MPGPPLISPEFYLAAHSAAKTFISCGKRPGREAGLYSGCDSPLWEGLRYLSLGVCVGGRQLLWPLWLGTQPYFVYWFCLSRPEVDDKDQLPRFAVNKGGASPGSFLTCLPNRPMVSSPCVGRRRVSEWYNHSFSKMARMACM